MCSRQPVVALVLIAKILKKGVRVMSWPRIKAIVVGILFLTSSYIANANETITYTYDAKGRVVVVTHSGTVNNNVVVTYAIDHADNRKNLKVTGAP